MAQTPPTFARPIKNAVYNPITLAWEPMEASTAVGGGDASAANQVLANASLSSIDTKLTNPVLGAGSSTIGKTDQGLPGSLLQGWPIRIVDSSGSSNVPSIINGITNPTSGTQGLVIAANSRLNDYLGSVTETAPATDTASSGQNGRLQRIAQRLTALIAQLPAALTGSGNLKVALVESTASQAVTSAELTSIDGKTPALGQALAAVSSPVVLPAAQITTLTPPAAITGYALEAGHLAAIDTATAKIPAQGQALAASSTPVVLTAIQVAALTPPASVGISTEPTYGGKTITYVPVNQASAGTTQLAAADATKKHKVLGIILTMSAAGSLKLTDGVADLLGPCDVGTTGGFVAPTSMIPYTETGAVNRALSLTTTVGAARGVVVVLTEV